MRTSSEVRQLRLCNSNVRNTGLIPGGGITIPNAMWQGQNKQKTETNLKTWLLKKKKNLAITVLIIVIENLEHI